MAAETPSKQVGRRVAASPVVSVIVPAYDTAPFIAETLDSVLAQTFSDYEIVVVNDGSPDADELERVLAPYFEHIVYIKQENRGLSGARNAAIRASRGRLLALLDSDDVWLPDYLAVQVAEMESDPSIDVLYPNALIFGDGPHAGKEYMEIYPSAGEVTFESLVSERCNVFICATMRREMVIRVGMFDDHLGNKLSEDFDLWLRIANHGGRIKYHRQVLVRYRRRPDSLTFEAVRTAERALLSMEKVNEALTLTASERETLEKAINHWRAVLRLEKGKRSFFHNDINGAISSLNEANVYFRSSRLRLALLLMRCAPRFLLGAYQLRNRWVLKTSAKS